MASSGSTKITGLKSTAAAWTFVHSALTSNNLQAEKSACERRMRIVPYNTYSKLDYEKVAYFLQCSSRIISLIHIMDDCIFVQRESPIEIM
mgnify:CR=1 FL=1